MWKGSCMIVETILVVFPARMASQKAFPKQMTRLLPGALLSSPQLEQPLGLGSLSQSGQFVLLMVQKNLILPLASSSATLLQRIATTSPRSLIAGLTFSHVGTNSGFTRYMLRKISFVLAVRVPVRLLDALRSNAIAIPIWRFRIARASALVFPALAKAAVHSAAGPEKSRTNVDIDETSISKG
jgi:hypothetical protein